MPRQDAFVRGSDLPPRAASFPDATNTGIPAGTTLTNSAGGTFSTPGSVLDALNITGQVVIAANNITLKRSRIRDGGVFTIVKINDGVTGTIIEDCEIDGLGLSGTGGSFGIEGSATIRRCNIFGVENALVPTSGSVITDNYVHDLASPGEDPHYDCIQMDGGNHDNISIEHNTLICPPNQTAAVMIDNYFGSCSNITVNNNKLRGGSYTCYADAQFPGGGTLTNIRYTNNRIGGWQFGPFSINSTTLADGTGNVNDDTGNPIPPP